MTRPDVWECGLVPGNGYVLPSHLAETLSDSNAVAGFGTASNRAFSGPEKKMTEMRKLVLTHLSGGPYNPLTQRGRRAAGAKKFALVLSKESRGSDTRAG